MDDVGVEQLVPLLGITSMEASLRFYVDGLGFTMTNKWIDDGVLRWCWLSLGGTSIMLQEFTTEWAERRKAEGKLGNGMSLNIMCKDAIALYRIVTARGMQAKRPFVGNRLWVTSLTDPDGYEVNFESPTDAPEESELAE